MAEQKVTTPVTPKPAGGKGEKKWLVGGLVGFVVILLITAVVLLLQIRKPTEPLPSPRPRPSPVTPSVKVGEGEGVCEVAFLVEAPEPPVCYEECDPADDLCTTGLECVSVSGVYRCVNSECSDETDCVCDEEELTCFEECDEDYQCEAGLYCMTVPGTSDKRCVNSECPDEEDCVCDEEITVACFGECSSDDECSGELRCMNFPGTNELRCLNSSCTSETDCVCPVGGVVTPTPTPTPTKGDVAQLPEAGGSLPVVLGASTGLLLIIVGLLLF